MSQSKSLTKLACGDLTVRIRLTQWPVTQIKTVFYAFCLFIYTAFWGPENANLKK